MAGREIWYKATAGNARFHTYVFQQRLGVLIDWYRVLRADQRGDRFETWGLINDPGCCTPGSPGCPAKSLDETYGFDYCPGDDELLAVRRQDRLPRSGAATSRTRRRPAATTKQSPCDLEFGTSTGALGFRKFPNPRFDAEKWRKINGGSSAPGRAIASASRRDPGSSSCVSHLPTARSSRRS